MRLRAIAPALALAAATLGCRADVNLTNPNTQTVASFWKTADQAQQGLTAAYNALNYLGTGLRWWAFAYDIRSDIGYSLSPWTDLANQSKFTFTSYNFDTILTTWGDRYIGIYRANQVIAYVPNISMDATARGQIVAEAQFLRALHYYQLYLLFGGNIPLILEPSQATQHPGPAGDAALLAQIEKDFSQAASVLPKTSFAAAGGHAVAASAQGMLGKVLLQEHKYPEAAAALAPIANQEFGNYSLVADYGSLFTTSGNDTPESLFEHHFGDPTTVAQGIYGLNVARMVGPCGPSYCDGRPTRWYFDQFFTDSTVDGKVDPRAQATFFWYQGPDTPVHGKTWAERAADPADAVNYQDTTRIYFKKWSEYYLPGAPTDIQWDAPLDYKVLRYADVLLMYAEALNEQGQTAAAATYVNQVRARAKLKPLAGLDQAGMRAAIEHERLLEFGLEGQRWADMRRYNEFTAAYLPTLIAHDDEFKSFVVGKSDLFPIPTAELNLNPNLHQNPGW